VLRLKREDVLVNAGSPDEIRVVTHLDVSNDAIADAIERFQRALG
jgi:acetylornithine/succinyldiaminopimelate/putrescine aminotransferase